MGADRYVRSMRVQVLGPLTVTVDGRKLELGGRKQRLVLALLVASGERTVSTEKLIDGVWGEDVIPTARKALQGYVHHLRTALGPVIRTETDGYSFHVEGELDADVFSSLHDRALAVVDADPERASEMLAEALGLWRGRAYGELGDELTLIPEVTRLESLRVAALGDRIDADLRLGRHGSLIGELEALTYEYPFDERFRSLHMTALFRSGRQVEALRSYERMRRFLADETGLEPSKELQDLEQRVLDQDPALQLAAAVSTPGVSAVRGYELRELIATGEGTETYRAYQRSVGREVAIRVLGPSIADDADFIATFLHDTALVAAIEHPHIALVFDTWREPGRAYQVTRWFGGGSLEDALTERTFGLDATLRLLDQVGGALDQAHRRGVIHGRVDASHVLLDEGGHPYLGGFTIGAGSAAADRRHDIRGLATMAHRMLVGVDPSDHPLATVVEEHDIPSSVLTVLEFASGPDGYDRTRDFLRALRQSAGRDVVATGSAPAGPVSTRNPYKGLEAFQEVDAGDFFGRDDLIEELVHKAAEARLVAVVGPSGAGKSSVVKAGLIPRLRASDPRNLLITDMYPGAFPFEELEGALLRIGTDRTSIIDDLLGDERGLRRVVKQVLPNDDAELVLVIDQFEELFSLVADEERRRLFLRSLVNALDDARSRLRVVITLRADFFDRPLEYPEFGALLKQGLVPVSLPDEMELAAAIAQPAIAAGVEFEPGLVAQIIHDVSGQPGELPLLQYSLTGLFEERSSNIITLEQYERTGRVVGALGKRAESIYIDLGAAAQTELRSALLRMVTVAEGADDLRRRVRRSELSGPDVDERSLDDALTSFGAARLLTFDRDPATRGPTVEVAHEALLREWERLRTWIEDQRNDLVVRRRLTAAMDEWRQANEDESFLPRGGRLAQFEDWAASTALRLTPEEHAFLGSAARVEAREAARSAQRRRRITVAAVLAAVITTVLAGLAWDRGNDASREAQAAEEARRVAVDSERQAQEDRDIAIAAQEDADSARAEADAARVVAEQESTLNRARVLAAQSTTEISEDVDRAVLLALAAGEVARTSGTEVLPEAIDALHRALGVHRIALRLPTGGGTTLAWSTDSTQLLTAGTTPEGAVWSAGTGTKVSAYGGAGTVTGAAWSPDMTRLATTLQGGSVLIWDTSSGERVAVLPRGSGDDGAARPIFDPTGRWLATTDEGRSVRIWDTTTWEQAQVLEVGWIHGADFSPDGRFLVVAVTETGGGFELWDATSWTRLETFPGGDQPESVAFSPDGRELATLDGDLLRIYDLETLVETRSWPAPSSSRTMDWSADGSFIAVSGSSRVIEIYDAETGAILARYAGHTAATVRQIRFDNNPTEGVTPRLASTDDTGLTLIWEVTPQRSIAGDVPSLGEFRKLTVLDNDTALVADDTGDLRSISLSPPYDTVATLEESTSTLFSKYFTVSNRVRTVAVTPRDDDRLGYVAFDPFTMEPLTRVWGSEPAGVDEAASRVAVNLEGELGSGPAIVDLMSGKLIAWIGSQGGSEWIYDASFSPDGSLVAVASDSREFRVHDAATGQTLAVIAIEPDSHALEVEFSSDGSLLAIGENSGRVRVATADPLVAGAAEADWLLADFTGVGGRVATLAFRSDDAVLAVAGLDPVINFWSTNDWSLAYSVEIDEVARGLAWTPDGTRVLVSAADAGLRLITVDPNALVELALRRATRGFTNTECDTFGLEAEACPLTVDAVRVMYGSRG